MRGRSDNEESTNSAVGFLRVWKHRPLPIEESQADLMATELLWQIATQVRAERPDDCPEPRTTRFTTPWQKDRSERRRRKKRKERKQA